MKNVVIAVCLAPLALLVVLAFGAHGRVDGEVLVTLAVSAAIALVSGLVGTALGFVTARGMSRLRLTLALLPFAVAPVVYAAASLFLYTWIGLSGTFLGVVLAHLTVAYAFAVVMARGIWTPHLCALGDTARTLGARASQAFIRVIVPAALPLLRVTFAQTFLVSWMQYGLTLVIGGGHVRTLPLAIYSAIAEADMRRAAAASLVLVLPALALVTLPRQRTA